MLRALLNLFHRPTIRSGMVRGARGPVRNPRFVSFIVQNNRRTLDTNFHDTVLRGRKLARQALYVLAAAAGTWVLVESAKALSTF